MADPALPPPYDAALQACVLAALARYDVLTIVASGTVVRGVPDPRSDLDIHVVHRAPFRERLQERHQRVPCEVFVNPLERIQGYFEQGARARRPITAHMFATGVAVYDPEGVGEALRLRAIDALRHVPDVDPEALNR
ncbi:hypothetical protein BH11ARM2_BH11ARM2_39220 [soil metagenome]